MTPEKWQSVKDKIDSLLELESAQRSAYLDQLAGTDSDLRSELESLLLCHDEMPEDFLNASLYAEHGAPVSALASLIGKRLGPYQVVSEIGKGGMGEVYRALRVDDQYHKEVAIKLIRAGRESGVVVTRFKNERQILAKLEHPNIARLLDGGTAEGVSYLVMELIEGESITDYCKRRALGLQERLALFLQICSAVQFAHQRLIVHRDIKPGNILVTADGIPKLLDFGISKILGDASETGAIDRTMTGVRMLTPAYASPEQIRGEPITTASDVYSLGMVLYELLVGRRPYHDVGPERVARAICEEEPGRPSTAAQKNGEAAALPSAEHANGPLGHATTGNLSRQLRGDLDNVILMALRKEPQRRYASVEQFAEDIWRYLKNLPVIARKDTARYRTSKFISRHKAGVAATAVVILTVIAAFVITVREARIAERRFNDVRALANSLIFEVHDSIKDLPGSTPARKIIADRGVQYLNSLVRESKGDVGLQRELATGYERLGLVQAHTQQDNLGDTKGSLDSYKKALELRKTTDSNSADWHDRLALGRCYSLLADRQRVARNTEGRANIDSAIAIVEALNKEHPSTFLILQELASEYKISSDIGYPGATNERTEVDELSSKTLATYESALKIKPDDLETMFEYAITLRGMGLALESTKPRAALDYYQRVVEIDRDLSQRSSAVKYTRELALAYRDLAAVYDNLGDPPHWIDNQNKSLEILKQLSRADPQNASLGRSLAIEYTNMALMWSRQGKFRLADEDWQKSLAIMRALVLADPGNFLQRHYLAGIVAAGGTIQMHEEKPEAALKNFEEARSIYDSVRDAGGASSFEIASAAQCSEKVGEAEALTGNTRAAAEGFHRSLLVAGPLIAGKPPDINALYATADAYSGLGDLTMKKAQNEKSGTSWLKDWQEARSWYNKSLDTWRRVEHPNRTAPANSLDAGDPALVAKKLRQCDAALSGSKAR